MINRATVNLVTRSWVSLVKLLGILLFFSVQNAFDKPNFNLQSDSIRLKVFSYSLHPVMLIFVPHHFKCCNCLRLLPITMLTKIGLESYAPWKLRNRLLLIIIT